MFRRRDNEQIQQTNIKRGITSHFARMLKILQQKHIQLSDGDEFVYSNDESNNLCNALEAAFLHGLKESVATKLSSYVGLSTQEDTPGYLDFWSVAQKFTHKDVIVQLKNLSQVTTDVGRCRAWIRLALNDGLMESYLHSITVDVKTLKYFYHSYSYLRDPEQPGILKNYLTGLMSLSFKLSLNSSVLCDWNHSTLQLVSNLSNSAPPPVVQTVTQPNTVGHTNVYKDPGAAQVKKKTSQEDDPIVVNKQKNRRASGEARQSSSMFTSINDVEAIRHIKPATGSVRSYSQSEGSTCSQASCPDPSGRSLMSVSPLQSERPRNRSRSPHLHPRPDTPLSSQDFRTTGTVLENEDLAVPVEDSKDVDCDVKAADVVEELGSNTRFLQSGPPRPRSRNLMEHEVESVTKDEYQKIDLAETEPCLTGRSITQEELKEPVGLRAARSPTPVLLGASPVTVDKTTDGQTDSCAFEQEKGIGDADDSELFDDIYSSGVEDVDGCKINKSDGLEINSRPQDEQSPRRPRATMLDPSLQDAILRRVLGDMDKQADKDREAKELQYRSPLSGSPQDRLISPSNRPQGKLSASPRAKSPVRVSVEADHAKSENSPARERSAFLEVPKGRCVEGEDDEDDDDVGSGRFGNSLSLMGGWSSGIEEQPPKEKKKTQADDKDRCESFASMLHNYMPSLPGEAGVTLDQVIEELPRQEEENVEDPGNEDGEDNARQGSSSDILQSQDSCLDDFEVVQSPSESIYGQSGVSSSRMVYLFRLPQEHGLSHQNFTCRGCSRPIGIIYGQPRLCAFDGGLYCYECHENMESIIPSSVVYDWNFKKRKVSSDNHKFLQELEHQPLYDIEELNPKLYGHVPELQDLKVLRQRLCFLKSYLFTCSQKMAEALRQKVWPREHLYDRRDLYSLFDLMQVQGGSMQSLLKELVRFASQHVYTCVLCSQKGYVCEICRNARVIFPFEIETTRRCERCKAVYHKTCLTEDLPCPKCERWGRRTQSCIRREHPEDYGASPTQGSESLSPNSHLSPSVSLGSY